MINHLIQLDSTSQVEELRLLYKRITTTLRHYQTNRKPAVPENVWAFATLSGQNKYHHLLYQRSSENVETSLKVACDRSLRSMSGRLAPSLFRGISALRNIVFLRSVLFLVYAPAEVTMFLSADIPRNRLGSSLNARWRALHYWVIQGRTLQEILLRSNPRKFLLKVHPIPRISCINNPPPQSVNDYDRLD